MNGRIRIWGLLFLLLASGLQAQGKVLTYGCDTLAPPPAPHYPPGDLKNIAGFEIDILKAVASRLDVDIKHIQNDWDSLVPGLQIGLYDIVIDAIVPSEYRSESVHFSRPYYVAYFQFIIREDSEEINSLHEARGLSVAVVKGSDAGMWLRELGGVDVREYENEVNSYDDLLNGRIDAALYDAPTCVYAEQLHAQIKTTGPHLEALPYAIAISKERADLIDPINQALEEMQEAGELRAILESWGLWNDETARYFGDFSFSSQEATAFDRTLSAHDKIVTWKDAIRHYWDFMPILLKGAWMTLCISVMAMVFATIKGFLMAIMRIYGPRSLSQLIGFYIEVIRGTPLLIQLFLIFYGLPTLGIKLSPLVAGVLGLGVNYSAFEAENYRAGLLSVPKGQMEAARALGMSHIQGLRHIVIPQAFRTVLPPITNDFISLLKDSSLVSVITIVELTKAYTQLAVAYYDFLGIGLLVALMYLLLGLPFVRLARWAEGRLLNSTKRAF